MAKNNLRSFRYSDKVSEILEGFQGNSMNEKFENLVLYCFDSLETRKKDLERIEADIKAKREQYYKVSEKLQEVELLIRDLETIKKYGAYAVERSKKIAADFDVTQPDAPAPDLLDMKCVTKKKASA